MEYIKYLGFRQHLLFDTSTKVLEVWVSNKNHASFGLIYKNTHLEFAHSFKGVDGKLFTTDQELRNYYKGII